MYIGPWQELKLGQMLSENTRYIKQTIHAAVCLQRQAEAQNFNAQVFANQPLAIEPPKMVDPYDHTLTLIDNGTLPQLRPPTPLADRLISRLEQYPPRSANTTAQPLFKSQLYPPFNYDRPLSAPRVPTPPSLPFLLPTTSTDNRLAIIRTPSANDSDNYNNNVTTQLMPAILSPLLSLPSIYSYQSPDIERRKQREKRSEKKKAERVRLNEMHQQRMAQLQLMWLDDQKRMEEEHRNRLKLDVLNLMDNESAARNNLVFMRHCNEAATKASAHFYFPVLSRSENDNNDEEEEEEEEKTSDSIADTENDSQTERTDKSIASVDTSATVNLTKAGVEDEEEEKRADGLEFRHHLTSSMPAQPLFSGPAANKTSNRPFNPNSKENTSGARSVAPNTSNTLTVPADSFGIIPENAHDEEADELVAWTNRLSMELESYWD